MPKQKPRQMEVLCCECGNPIPSVPIWLTNAKVRFECEECRQKNPGQPLKGDGEPRRAEIKPEPEPIPIELAADIEEDETVEAADIEAEADPEPDVHTDEEVSP